MRQPTAIDNLGSFSINNLGSFSVSVSCKATQFISLKNYGGSLMSIDQDDFWACFPKGTILPYAGDLTHLPRGWEVCDGSNGTIDLVGRIPIGTKTIGQAGTKDGTADHVHVVPGQKTSGDSGPTTPQDPHPGGGIEVSSPGHTHELAQVATTSQPNLPLVTYLYFIQKVA